MKKTKQVKENGRERAPVAEEIQVLREQLSSGILRAAVIVGLLVSAVATYDSIVTGQAWTIPFYWGAYVIVLAFTFWRGRAYKLRIWILISLLYVLALIDFSEDGPSGSGRLLIALTPFLAGLLLGRRAGVGVLIIDVVSMGIFGALYATGMLVIPDYAGAANPTRWAAGVLVLLMSGVLMIVSLDFFLLRLGAALTESRQLARDLDIQRAGLEVAVDERTEALARRARYLEVTAKVTRGTTELLDNPVGLFQRVVDLISTEFDFYNTALFLTDAAGEWVEIRAASSEGGRRIVERGFRLRVGHQGIVGYVAGRGDPHLVSDVEHDVFFEYVEDLPDTRAELALPLRVRGEVIGVLDVQSTNPGEFNDEVIAVLQSLADGVAVAINNARLFQQVQKTIEAERLARGDMSREAWLTLLRGRPDLGFVKQAGVVSPASGSLGQEMRSAVQTGAAVTGGADGRALAVPIVASGQTIAVLNAHLPEGTDRWMSSQVSMMETLAVQLGQALDRARLYEATQRSAARERTVAEATSRMREPLEIEDVLRTAADEMRRALDLEDLAIRLTATEGTAVSREEGQ